MLIIISKEAFETHIYFQLLLMGKSGIGFILTFAFLPSHHANVTFPTKRMFVNSKKLVSDFNVHDQISTNV